MSSSTTQRKTTRSTINIGRPSQQELVSEIGNLQTWYFGNQKQMTIFLHAMSRKI